MMQSKNLLPVWARTVYRIRCIVAYGEKSIYFLYLNLYVPHAKLEDQKQKQMVEKDSSFDFF